MTDTETRAARSLASRWTHPQAGAALRSPADAPPPRIRRTAPALLLAAALLSACAGNDRSSGPFAPYRADLPQGNYLTADSLEKVKPGMSREQVRIILGSPLLNPMFRPDRWDYVFRYQYPSGKAETRRVSIRFKDDAVENIQADALPPRDDATDPLLPGQRATAAAAKR